MDLGMSHRPAMVIVVNARLTIYSRQELKKYILANNKLASTPEAQFKSQLNRALAKGVASGTLTQPKGMSLSSYSQCMTDNVAGPSGPVKLAKPDSKAAPVKKAAAPKAKTEKAETKPATKKAPAKKTAATKAKTTTTTKKAPAASTKKAAPAAKPKAKANTAKPRKTAAAVSHSSVNTHDQC